MRIGPWWFQIYTLRVVAGALLGMLWLWWAAPRRGFSRRGLVVWLWLVALCALLLGRLGYRLKNPAYFVQNPESFFRFHRTPGMDGGTALAGGLIIVWIWSKVTRCPINRLLALLAPMALWLAAGAWWGCWDVGCAWGRATNFTQPPQTWMTLRGPDLYHIYVQRYAVQVLGATWAVMMAIFAMALRDKGDLALILYIVGSALLSLLRGDSVPQVAGMRVDTALDVFLICVLGLLIVLGRYKRTPTASNLVIGET